MSEEKVMYKTNTNHYNTEVLWLAKRLKDIAKDISKLETSEQENVMKRAYELDPDLIDKLKDFLG